MKTGTGDTFFIHHRSYLGPVWECRAKRRGRGWSVLARIDGEDSWEFAEETYGWYALSRFKKDGFYVIDSQAEYRSNETGPWPDGEHSLPPYEY